MQTFGLDVETQDGKVYCTGVATGDRRECRLGEWTPDGVPVMHNAKYDLSFLDPDLQKYPYFRDTIIQAALLGYRPLNLPFLTETFTGVKLDKTAVKERNTVRFEERGEAVLDMCSLDGWASWQLDQLWAEKMKPYEHLLEIERKFTKVLMDMERRGLPVSQKKLEGAYTTIYRGMARTERTLRDHGLNPIDVKGFAEWFWKGKRPVHTPDGSLSTAKAVLREHMLPDQEAATEAFIKWKSLDKFKSTYLDAWKGQESIHPSFNQTGTVTWRLSCSGPNLQNVPHHGNDDVPLYTLFEAPPGFVLISADYSQLQLRVLANMTQDPAMIEAYLSGRDLHQETHSVIGRSGFFEKMQIDNPDHQRRIAKDTNFGIAFNITAYALAPRIKMDQDDAQSIIDAFYGGYKKVKPWQRKQIAFAEEHGYVETFKGRPIYVPCMLAERGKLRSHGLNQAVCGAIQGGEAEIVKDAMIRCSEYLVCQVHDEVLYCVPEKEAEEYCQFLAKNLTDCRHDVPYVAEPSIGKSWGELKSMPDVWGEDLEED